MFFYLVFSSIFTDKFAHLCAQYCFHYCASEAFEIRHGYTFSSVCIAQIICAIQDHLYFRVKFRLHF